MNILYTELAITLNSMSKNALMDSFQAPFPGDMPIAKCLSTHYDNYQKIVNSGRNIDPAMISEQFLKNLLPAHPQFTSIVETFNSTRIQDVDRKWSAVMTYFLPRGEEVERGMATKTTLGAAASNTIATDGDQDDNYAAAARRDNRGHPGQQAQRQPKVSIHAQIDNLDLNVLAPALRKHGLRIVADNRDGIAINRDRDNQRRPTWQDRGNSGNGQQQRGGPGPPARNGNRGRAYLRGQGGRTANAAADDYASRSDALDAIDEAAANAAALDDSAYYIDESDYADYAADGDYEATA
jgi:hypothetical protein